MGSTRLYMQPTNLDITFPQHDLPMFEVQKKHAALIIFVFFNKTRIRCTLIDNGLVLNVFSIDLLDKLVLDKNLIQPYYISTLVWFRHHEFLHLINNWWLQDLYEIGSIMFRFCRKLMYVKKIVMLDLSLH